MAANLLIRPFEPEDQEDVRKLIEEGLAEHFFDFDPNLNPDLDDIKTNYLQKGSLFVVAELNEEIVGTGALIPETKNTGRIVRVSVATAYRKMGIGRTITEYLIRSAPQYQYLEIVVETNEDWFGAIRLYQSCGFSEYNRRDGEIHMMLRLKR